MAGRIDIALKWFDHGRGLELPRQQSAGAAGVDLLAALDVSEPVQLLPGKRAVVPCGFAMALPEGYEAQVRPRSGLASKYGVSVLNSPGTIDADYRGEVKVILINLGEETFEIRRGDRIAQMVVSPVSAVGFSEKDTLNETERGSSGFGSTGR
jgi:dUTP pyrophosphatase